MEKYLSPDVNGAPFLHQAAPAFVAAASSSKPSKQAALSLPAAAASLPAPILAGSRTVQKRAADEKAERARLKASRRRKRELRAAGHAPPKPRGAEPERDALERRLLVTATKGVVQLFNAVARVQRAARDGDGARRVARFPPPRLMRCALVRMESLCTAFRAP